MTQKNPKLRLSFSLISAWERGDVDGAVNTYLHLDSQATPQMIEGRELHEKIAKHIEETGNFPKWFFEYPLVKPEAEKEVVVSYNELFDLKCVIDCLDTPLMFEYKTGVTDSLGWARTNQVPLYFLICELAGIPVDSAFVIRFDQYANNSDFTVVHNNPELRDSARNVIDSVGPEIFSYFLESGII